ncbi:MAG: ATP-binding protein [Elainellaceae cyanobacterium]
MAVAVGVTGWLAFFNGEQAVNQLVERYKQEIATHVQQELTHCLDIPHIINQTNAAAISLGLLDFDDPAMLKQYFWQQLQQFPAVNYIYAGSEAGGIVGVGRNAEGELRSYDTEGFVEGNYRLYRIDADGSQQEQIDASEDYDARRRPWYQASAQAGKEAWSEIYLYVGEPLLGIAASRPIFDETGQRLGVMATDLILTQIGEFLSNLELSPSSTLFIMERSGNLVATSTDDPPFTVVAPGESQQRRHASESEDPLTHLAYGQLVERFGQLTNIAQPKDLVLGSGGDRSFMRVVPFDDGRGIDWLIVMVLPETDFMAQIYRNTRCAIALCIAAVLIAMGLSIAIARRLSHPLRQLSEASQALAQGEFSKRLPPRRISELNTLSKSFNLMAQQLQDSFDQLAQRNRHLEKRVEARTAHLTQTNYQLSLLLRSVSHDLRNPITGMLMVFDNVKLQAASHPQQTDVILTGDVLDALISSGERQLRLVNSLLDNHRTVETPSPSEDKEADPVVIDALRNPSLTLQPYSLRQIVDQVVQDLQPLLVERQTILRLGPLDTLPLVLADPDQLWRVVENLLSNAITHNPAKTQVAIQAQMLTSSRTGPTVCCKVIDDGVGIAFEKQTHLFEPYRRGDPQTPGLGLGLHVCRRIIEAHNGIIGVLSQPGKGATFWFTLPIASGEAAEA